MPWSCSSTAGPASARTVRGGTSAVVGRARARRRAGGARGAVNGRERLRPRRWVQPDLAHAELVDAVGKLALVAVRARARARKRCAQLRLRRARRARALMSQRLWMADGAAGGEAGSAPGRLAGTLYRAGSFMSGVCVSVFLPPRAIARTTPLSERAPASRKEDGGSYSGRRTARARQRKNVIRSASNVYCTFECHRMTNKKRLLGAALFRPSLASAATACTASRRCRSRRPSRSR